MKQTILFLTALFICTSSYADSAVEKADERYCGVLAVYANRILQEKVMRHMQQEDQYPKLERENDIHPSMIDSINNIIEIVYDENFPVITSAAELSAIVYDVHKVCLEQRKELREN